MEKIAREQAEPRTDTLVWGKNAVTELLKSGGAVDTVDRMFCLFPLFLTSQMPRFAQ